MKATVRVSKFGTPEICLVAVSSAEKGQLTKLRKAFEAKKRLVVGRGIRGESYPLFYLEDEQRLANKAGPERGA